MPKKFTLSELKALLNKEHCIYIKPNASNGNFEIYIRTENESAATLIAISYDYKNELFEGLSSNNFDGISFAEYSELKVNQIGFFEFKKPEAVDSQGISSIQCRFTKEEYINTYNQIQKELAFGNIYEINFCIEHYAENAQINSLNTFFNLWDIAQSPYSCYLKIGSKHLICGSPESYIVRKGQKLISQPMKGTRKRSKDHVADELLKQELKENIKERSENTMIVDLVRNDLSKVAERGSVSVEELCEVKSFKTIHQMISTVSCELKESVTWKHIVDATFPMGSMTGVPKKSALKIIENFEKTKRGIFSGTVGLIESNGDFDINVVIRSIVYNEENNYLSIQTGSAITLLSNALEEYEECIEKAQPMFKALGIKNG